MTDTDDCICACDCDTPGTRRVVIAKVHGAASRLEAWQENGRLLGLVEIAPGRRPVHHKLCDCFTGAIDIVEPDRAAARAN
jgi:hypothetical protein